MPIDIIVHSPGGLVLSTEQIAMALKRHKAPVKIFVPHYAMSGGTLLCLAADHVIMDENAVLGPVDPQLSEFPAASILKVVLILPVAAGLPAEVYQLMDLFPQAMQQRPSVQCIPVPYKKVDERGKQGVG